MEKIKIQRKTNNYKKSKERAVIRINPDEYNQIVELSNETGQSMCEIASLLLRNAIKYVEITD